MIRVGIIGSENSHALHFGKILNVEKKLRGIRAVSICGETEQKTAEVAEAAKIPEIVSKPEDMIGKIDVAIIDHRHAKHHYPAAVPLVKSGVHVFVDKPFCWTVEQAKALLSLAKRKKVLVTSYSCVRYSTGFLTEKMQISELGALSTVDYYGPCDINSEYGGIFFYGIHQVEMMAAHLGPDVKAVQFNKGEGKHHTATIHYKGDLPIVTLHLIDHYRGGFRYTVCGEKDTVHLRPDYSDLYVNGLTAFFRMLKGGRNELSRRELIAPVAVLESLATSIKTGKKVLLPKF